MLAWRDAQDVLAAYVSAISSSPSSAPASPIRSVLLVGPPRVGKRSVIDAVAKRTNVRVVTGSLATVLLNPRKNDDAALPFASTWRNLSSASATSPTIVVWPDLDVCIGGTTSSFADADFAADVLESLCRCLKSAIPDSVIIIATFSLSSSSSSSSTAGSQQQQTQQLRLLHQAFDVVLHLSPPSKPPIRAQISQPLDAAATRASPWDEIVGHDEVKCLLRQTSSSGVLLYGVPGTGKTMLARALSKSMRLQRDDGEDNSFFSLTASSLVSAEVGVSERNLTDIFEQARRRAPSVIFIDEVQAVFRRGDASASGGDARAAAHEKRLTTTFIRCIDQTREMCAAGKCGGRVVVVAATNVPRLVDPALLRFGRLHTAVQVPPPTAAEIQHMAWQWLARRHGIAAAATTSTDSTTLANWLVETAIRKWASSRDDGARPTGADVTGLLNLIDLRLEARRAAAASSSGGEQDKFRQPVIDEIQHIVESAMARVKPSVTAEALEAVNDFEL